MNQYRKAILSSAALSAILLAVWAAPLLAPARADADPHSLALAAHSIFQKNCTCHAAATPPPGAPPFNVNKRQTLLDTKVVTPGKSADSELIDAVTKGRMPLGGDPLPAADIATLKAWIDAGAPDWDDGAAASSSRTFIPERALLGAIQADLQAANERARPYLRYYSLANIHNNPEISGDDLAVYRTSLSKLINSLSWNHDVVKPTSIGPAGVLLRIDLRDFNWTPETWQTILSAYPYGYRAWDASGEVQEIQALSGATLPYVRVDWFVGNACVAPLYNRILGLPTTLAALEEKLGVNEAQDIQEEKIVRAGLRDSGVSRNNRAVDRHRSLYGSFWRSFEYSSSTGERNIFENPVDLHPDGGEIIFNLPNGLQAYLITDAEGKSLDFDNSDIVQDKTNADDRVVRNGRSCIGCHFQGMNPVPSQVRDHLETQQSAHFDLDHALALYRPQKEVDQELEADSQRFLAALAETGSPRSESAAREPISLLARWYADRVTARQAAADNGLSLHDFQDRLRRSSDLERLGLDQLLGDNGAVKRDVWEQNFGMVVETLRVGTYLAPAFSTHPAAAPGNPRHTIAIGALTAPDTQVGQQARQALLYWFSQSSDLRIVDAGADCNLTLRVQATGNTHLTITVGDAHLQLLEQATGESNDVNFLAEQLANRVNFRLTVNWLPVAATGAPGTAPTAASSHVPIDPGVQIQAGVQGPVHIALSVDRGPGSTYKFGETIGITFRVDRDCSLTLFGLDSTGARSVAFADQPVRAGRVYSVSDLTGQPAIAGGVPGIETLVAEARLNGSSKSINFHPGGAGFAQGIADSRTPDTSTAVVRFFTVDNALNGGKGLLEVGAK